MKKLVLLVVIVATAAGGYWYATKEPPREADMPMVRATIGNKTFRLHAPQTELGRQTGLAAFPSLAEDEGMILRGMPEGIQSVWMKGMRYDIDVIWVNKAHQVVYMVQGMSRADQTSIYHNPPNQPSLFIIELPNDSCNKYQISIGQMVTIND